MKELTRSDGQETFSIQELHEVEDKELLSRYQATLVGGAIGDTLGMSIEGWNREQIRRHVPGGRLIEPSDPIIIKDDDGHVLHKDETGRIPYVSPYLTRGAITDDTWLTIATARSIVEAGRLDLDDLARHSVAVYEEQTAQQVARTPSGDPIAVFLHPDSEIPQAFGGTTIAALENIRAGISPLESGVMSRNPGNGPAIKMAPVGMYMHRMDKYDEGLDFAEAVGKMTHRDPRSVVSGVVQAHAIYALLGRASRDEFLDSVVGVSKEWEKSMEQGKKVTLTERLQWVADNRDADDLTAYELLEPGWAVTKNYPFTIFMFQKYWSQPLKGLIETVNYGGDCDSTAAMYGTLAGAKHDIEFPENWMGILEQRDELTRLASKIYSLK